MPRLLIVSYWFPPLESIGSLRVASFAKHLSALGWDVGVITVKDGSLVHDGQRCEKAEYAEVHHVPGFSLAVLVRNLSMGAIKGADQTGHEARLSRLGLRRRAAWLYHNLLCFPDECWPWYVFGRRRALRVARQFRPDIILSSALPASSHLFGAEIKRTTGAPWVADYRDLWCGHIDKGRSPWMETRHQRLEERALRNVDLTLSVSPPYTAILRERFNKPSEVVFNGFDPSDYAGAAVSAANDGRLRIVYTGMIYTKHQHPALFFEALRRLADSGKINEANLQFRYFGPNRDLIHALARAHGVLDLCEIHGPVSRSEVIAAQKNADLLLFLTFNVEGWLSGKLMEYLGAAKPVLAVGPEEPASAEIIGDTGCGICCHTVDSTAKTIATALSAPEQFSGAGRLAREKYTRQVQARRLDRMLRDLLTKRQEPGKT